ncbi:MAG: hypothetical protein ACRENB_06660 [Gemmatimonadales bacterium]
MTKPSSTKPLESKYTFFTDADLGEMIPKALEQIGLAVERHTIRSVIAFRDKHEAPFIAKVYQPDAGAREHAKRSGGTAKGRVEMSLSYSEWLSTRLHALQ